MDSDGIVVDKEREPDANDEDILTWYKNMLTGGHKNPEEPSREALIQREFSQGSQHNGSHHV